MEVKLLRFPHKKIRACCIKEYMQVAGYKRAICFSCGNAATALEEEGIDVLHIGEHGSMNPNRWWTMAEIRKCFPDFFDATSGHLPIELMNEIGIAYKNYLGELDSVVYVPSGSGETIICLKLAYPRTEFIAVYNLDKATEYSENAPLNILVNRLAADVICNGSEYND